MSKKKEQPAPVGEAATVTHPSQLLLVESVAQRLALGVVTVKRMIRRGELPVIRLGHNTVRVRQADLDSFIESKKV